MVLDMNTPRKLFLVSWCQQQLEIIILGGIVDTPIVIGANRSRMYGRQTITHVINKSLRCGIFLDFI